VIPEPVLQAAGEVLGGAVSGVRPVGGGCINHAVVLTTDRAAQGFLKWNPRAPRGFFQAERRGLGVISATLRGSGITGLRVPLVLASGEDPTPWLLLEYVPQGRETQGYWQALGTGLARLHQARPPELGKEPNFLGSLVQENPEMESWPDFWLSARLVPRLEDAYRSGHFQGGAREDWDRLLERLGEALPDLSIPERSLLHGDLWSGNVYPDQNGRPVLVDPAVYTGDPLVDLAMARLFGGFGSDFYAAYEATWGTDAPLSHLLVDAYQLYPLLAHVNLFGSGYEAGTMERVRRLLSRL
jgi:protein-ribulosamine 3-kinase